MKLSIALLLAVFGLVSLAPVTNAATGHWCGKPYGARHVTVPPTPNVNPNPPVITTTKQGFAAQFRYQPYLSTDAAGSLVVNVPAAGTYTILAKLADGTVLLPATTVPTSDLTQEITGLDLSKVNPQLAAYNVTIVFAANGVAAQTSSITLYKLPV
ncbi:hypothetical protein BC938DRAFT_476841, partial [Jimgerdemannia flammicorona]